jgi:hypothetical protein
VISYNIVFNKSRIFRHADNTNEKDYTMRGSHCRLYDENLVRNIMITTGMSILQFVNEHKSAHAEDICEFVEYHAEDIIAETIKNLNQENQENEGGEFDTFGAPLSQADEDAPPLDDEDAPPETTDGNQW